MKKFKYFILCFLLLGMITFSASSCDVDDNDSIAPPAPTPPLFQRQTVYNTSIYSGNYLYNSFLSADFENIYFQGKDSSSLVMGRFNGENKTQLISQNPFNISVVGDLIFYMNDTINSNIYKISNDGTGHVAVSDFEVDNFIAEFLYLFFTESENNFVYRALHDGSEKTLLLEQNIKKIYIFGDSVYLVTHNNYQENGTSLNQDGLFGVYIVNLDDMRNADLVLTEQDYEFIKLPNNFESLNVNKDYLIYKLNNNINFIDLTNKSEITRQNLEITSVDRPFIVSEDYIYYINTNDNNRIYKAKLIDFSEKSVVVNDKVHEFVVCGNSVYYRRENSNEIYRTSTAGGYSSKIT